MVLIPLLLISAAWLPGSEMRGSEAGMTKALGGNPSSAVETPRLVARPELSPTPARYPRPVLATWMPAALEDRVSLGTALAGACLLLPFTFSMWATVRKNT